MGVGVVFSGLVIVSMFSWVCCVSCMRCCCEVLLLYVLLVISRIWLVLFSICVMFCSICDSGLLCGVVGVVFYVVSVLYNVSVLCGLVWGVSRLLCVLKFIRFICLLVFIVYQVVQVVVCVDCIDLKCMCVLKCIEVCLLIMISSWFLCFFWNSLVCRWLLCVVRCQLSWCMLLLF